MQIKELFTSISYVVFHFSAQEYRYKLHFTI